MIKTISEFEIIDDKEIYDNKMLSVSFEENIISEWINPNNKIERVYTNTDSNILNIVGPEIFDALDIYLNFNGNNEISEAKMKFESLDGLEWCSYVKINDVVFTINYTITENDLNQEDMSNVNWFDKIESISWDCEND